MLNFNQPKPMEVTTMTLFIIATVLFIVAKVAPIYYWCFSKHEEFASKTPWERYLYINGYRPETRKAVVVAFGLLYTVTQFISLALVTVGVAIVFSLY
jgi:hypothetical protein